MKKILMLIAAGVLVGGIVAGCGPKEEGDTAATAGTGATGATGTTGDKPADDKSAATGTTGTTDAGTTGTPGDKPADDKGAAPDAKTDPAPTTK